ncbi:E3 ubiquitin-protein ligase RNF31-like [Hypanus sabinus]|uniref:E3 ubiquitin-protein ligase RNF31-like n=1 Tax=Hypanus sabinus TaxID=79690 RepID=UPI0028C3BBF3|nr:E3 ubiquitin-protein ligase RNF31-like [Hypanus sabinus]
MALPLSCSASPTFFSKFKVYLCSGLCTSCPVGAVRRWQDPRWVGGGSRYLSRSPPPHPVVLSARQKCNDPACRLKDSLHAHHPRDCLSYLRDWPVKALQELLQRHRVNFDTVPPAGAEATPGGNCRVMEQREEQGKLIDEACGKEACQGHAGLCESHYKEYLVSRINGHSLDPALLYTLEDMEVFLKRSGKQQAAQAQGETEAQYKARLLKVITTIPLGDKVPRIRK